MPMFSKRRPATTVSPPLGTRTGGQSLNLQSDPGRVNLAATTPLGSTRNSTAAPPPRFPDLSSLASNVAEEGSAADLPADDPLEQRWDIMDDAIHDRMSFLTLESNATTPTYTTLVPAGHSRPRRSTFGGSTTTLVNPPSYSSLSYGYSATNPREFEYAIRGSSSGSKGQPWATLKLYNTGVRGGKGGKHPKFYEGDNIFGRVELSLFSPHTVKNIKLVLKGTIITSAMDSGSVDFLEQAYTIWDRSFGDPRQPRPEEKFDGKLEGDYIFPFSIPFPKYVNLSTLEAVQASGQPVDSQIQLPPQPAGFGGHIRVFPTEDSLRKSCAHYPGARDIDGASSETAITPGRTEPRLGRKLCTATLHVEAPSSPSERASPLAPLESEPGPSTITPSTHSRDGTPSPSTSQEITRRGSRWSFSKASTSTPSLKKTCPTPAEFGFQGCQGVHLISAFGGFATMYDLNTKSQIPAFKSGIPVVLPQSFLERDVKGNTRYELTLLITHGRFSSSGKVNTTVSYRRTSIPPPMPWLRSDAYQERQTLPIPMMDPEVWHQLPTVSMKGAFLQQRELRVNYALSLANPLSYARGAVIPCYLTISCDDISALNLLSDPRSPRVRLTRVVRYLGRAGGSGEVINPRTGYDVAPYMNSVVPQVSPASVGHSVKARQRSASTSKLQIGRNVQQQKHKKSNSLDHQSYARLQLPKTSVAAVDALAELNTSEDDGKTVSTAWWWVPQGLDENEVEKVGIKSLQGEIHLPSALQPSCPFPLFNISYRVELLAPVSHAFEPDFSPTPKDEASSNMDRRSSENPQKNRVYASQSVEITTDSRDDEPNVVPFTKPPGSSWDPRVSSMETVGDRVEVVLNRGFCDRTPRYSYC